MRTGLFLLFLLVLSFLAGLLITRDTKEDGKVKIEWGGAFAFALVSLLVLGLFFGRTATSVTEVSINDSGKWNHTEKKYLFVYRYTNELGEEQKKWLHFWRGRYVYNNSYNTLFLSPVAYGKASTQGLSVVRIRPHEFVRVKQRPTLFFGEPPQYVKIQGDDRGSLRWLLDEQPYQ